MIGNKLKQLTMVGSCLALAACASQTTLPEQAPESTFSSIPAWVSTPTVEGGIAATECVVPTPGTSMSISKKAATERARVALANQLEVNIKAMTKDFQRMSETAGGPSSGTSFESVSKSVTQRALVGSQTLKADYVNLPPTNEPQLCVMVGLPADKTEAAFKEIMEKAKVVNLAPTSEAVLFERFLADQAQNELEAELQGQ